MQWEVLVVDNNSKDRTRELVEDFCRRYPDRFRYLFEPHQGKSYALNTGIGKARGDVLAFLDDDVTIEPTWLQDLTASLHNGEWAGAGGRTLPDRKLSLPRWLSPEERYAFAPLALFDLGPNPGQLSESPFGNNMAFRKEMFEKHGLFRTDLGPRPGSLHPQKCEDSEFGCRLLAAGERLRYEPSAVIYHAIPENRLQKSYFLAWWYDKARSDVRAFGIGPHPTWCVFGIPVVLFRRLAVWLVRWMVGVEPSWRFSCKMRVWGVRGAIRESYYVARDAKSVQRGS
jgi:glycosyltransferase involved in cell wall biosynthesis